MTREEIANELFNTGKKIKQSFLREIAVFHISKLKDHSIYLQYMQILNSLNALYRSLDTGFENFDWQIDEAVNSVYMSTTPDTEKNFACHFLSILNDILINTIKFRKKYCLIRRNDPVPGFASHIITNLGQIAVCIDNGYIPVVDTVNVTNIFTDLSKLYSVNAWELYFMQPFSVKYGNILLTNEIQILDGIPDFMPNYSMDCLMNPDLMLFWKTIMKKYMPFSPEINTKINHYLKNLPFGSDKKILGVLCRGTDYTNGQLYNHPVQPSSANVLAKADEFMHKYQCDYCYLATEDQEILNAFRNKFSKELLTTQEIYYEADLTDTINQVNISKHIDIHYKNTEYLIALALLSKCQYFIGGRTSGTVVSFLLSAGFEKQYVWNCGRYGIDDDSTLNSYIL